MLRKILYVWFTLGLGSQISADIVLPKNHFIPGWTKSGKMRRFIKDDLYNYINGGAVLFQEFGFEELLLQRYRKSDEEITLELYRMENPESALGIYLMKCGKETPIEGIPVRNSGSRFQFTIVKGSCFIQINNFRGNKTLIPVMVAMTQNVVASIPETDPVRLLDVLPEENLVSGSGMIIRGPYGLEPIFTFGEGDILQLGGNVYGAVGDYTDSRGKIFTRIIIMYPHGEAVTSAYENLHANLDSYITISKKWARGFTFKDYQDKFGIVEIKDRTMEIKVNLSEKPINLIMVK